MIASVSMSKRGIRRLALVLASAISSTMFSVAAANAPAPPSLSKRGPDPVPAQAPLNLNEVFVTSSPQKANEAQTIKDAYAKVKNGGVIFITQPTSDISNDNSGLVITRPITIALDPDLKTKMAINGKDDLARATINGASDGGCLTIEQEERGEDGGRREPRNEVTLRDVEFAPHPGSNPETCITLNEGRLFLENVAVVATGKTFKTAVLTTGGELIARKRLRLTASSIGLDTLGGAVEIAEGATITIKRQAPAGPLGSDARCRDAVKTHPVGVHVGRTSDARVADSAVLLRGLSVTGADIGVCAAGARATISASAIYVEQIGILAERAIRLSNTRISGAGIAGIIVDSPESEILETELLNNGVGAIIGGKYLPTFKSNRFHFNGEAIAYGFAIPSGSRRIVSDFYASLAGNVVACNAAAGKLADHQRFRKAKRNIRYDNSEKICKGEESTKLCDERRRYYNLSGAACAGS